MRAKVFQPKSGPHRARQVTAAPFRSAIPSQVRQILHSLRLQPQLTVDPPEDVFEREADRTPEPIPEVTPDLESRIAALEESGQPLPSSERAFFEPRFRQGFADVRIHNDSEASDLAKQVHASAFT